MNGKIVIYQLLPRLFGNTRSATRFNGTIAENGCGKFNDLSDKALSELKKLSASHLWLTGIIRHSTRTDYPDHRLPASHPDIVKGMAGSPYAINDYFDLDPDLAEKVDERWQEFNALIDRIHRAGMKVIIDFVPNHVARDYGSRHLPAGSSNLGATDNRAVAFSPHNNFYYLPGESLVIRGLSPGTADRYHEMPAKATGNDVFRPDPDANDWYETVKLNYGYDYAAHKGYYQPLPDTWIKMTEILFFWSSRGIDGFRCDMAGMVPVEFWEYAIRQVKSEYPDLLFIAELYEPQRYREYLEQGLFDYLYDKVGWYDTARAIVTGHGSTRGFSSSWQALGGLDSRMVRFLENHDEQRIASPHFAGDPAPALPAFAAAAFMHSGPVMIYCGQEVGEPAEGATGFSGDDGRTTIFDYAVMPEFRKWFNDGRCDGGLLIDAGKRLRESYTWILRHATTLPHFSAAGFYDVMWANEDHPSRDRVYAFLRYGQPGEEEALLVVMTFESGMTETNIRIPEHALQTVGLGQNQRIMVKGVWPDASWCNTLLMSQIVRSGITVRFSDEGYAVLSVS